MLLYNRAAHQASTGYTILYYIRLLYSILYYTVIYFTILYYTLLHCVILYYTMLYYTTLGYTIGHYTILRPVPAAARPGPAVAPRLCQGVCGAGAIQAAAGFGEVLSGRLGATLPGWPPLKEVHGLL